jgi:hypothetical protein
LSGGRASERSEQQRIMGKTDRAKAREAIQAKGLQASMRIGKLPLTAKQKRFAEAIVLEGMTGADAYRTAYDTQGKPAIAGVEAHKLRANPKIANTIEALERAKELAASQSAESLKSLVISTLVDVAANSDRDSVRVAAVKTLGTVVGVDMFRETKRVEHVKDSGEIRAQILDQLRTITMQASDVQDVDATALLTELVGGVDDASLGDPTGGVHPQAAAWDSGSDIHSTPHEQSPQFSEPTPISSKTPTPRGDIFEENDDAAPQ